MGYTYGGFIFLVVAVNIIRMVVKSVNAYSMKKRLVARRKEWKALSKSEKRRRIQGKVLIKLKDFMTN